MRIVDVYPLTRESAYDTLSYFTTHNVAPGDFVEIPLRNKHVPALVAHARDLRQEKTQLKQAAFALKKITRVYTAPASPLLIEALRHAAVLLGQPVGALLAHLLPHEFFSFSVPQHNRKQTRTFRMCAVQETRAKRYIYYTELIARHTSALCIFPTIQEAEAFHAAYAPEGLLIHSGLSKKKLRGVWEHAQTTNVIVGTTQALALMHPERLLIVDHVGSRAYDPIGKLTIDVLHIAASIGHTFGVEVYCGDITLPNTLVHALNAGTAERSTCFTETYTFTSRWTCSAIKEYRADAHGETLFLADEARALLNKKTPVFMYATRRGKAPLTVCNDCGQTVMCARCEAPLVLHGTNFRCHHCGHTYQNKLTCASCGSWNLKALGIGSERLIEELRAAYPNRTLFRIDADTTKTKKQALDIYKAWHESTDGILVGTQMALSFVENVPHIIVPSLETLFTIPDVSIHETIFRLLIHLRSCATEHVLVQTQHPERAIFEYVAHGNTWDFQQYEQKERKQYALPPFHTQIDILLEGKRDAVTKLLTQLRNISTDYETITFPDFTPVIRNMVRVHFLITTQADAWPDAQIASLFSLLPPSARVTVHGPVIHNKERKDLAVETYET